MTLVSHVPGSPGTTANGASSSPLISGDGGAVVFVSDATNLVPGTDTNGASDVFLYERATAAVVLVSRLSGGPHTSGDARSHDPSISADGAVVVFSSDATNLAATTDTNGQRRGNVFLYDHSTGALTLVSHALGAPATTGDGGSFGPAVSGDGTVVVFQSLATDLVANDFNGYADAFAYVYERADPPPPTPNGPDLVQTAMSDPPLALQPGDRLSVTDTVRNEGNAGAIASTTRYYLSLVRRKTQESKLLGARPVPSLAPGASSQGTATVLVPVSIVPATYYLLACADDLGRVAEEIESNNCTASASPVTMGRPDLVVTAVSNPPVSATRGSSFTVTETVANEGALRADPSTTRYYLSLDGSWSSADRRLMGSRAVPQLDAGASFPPASVTVVVPSNMAPGSYFLLACADDLRRVIESSETNNCTASAGKVTVP